MVKLIVHMDRMNATVVSGKDALFAFTSITHTLFAISIVLNGTHISIDSAVE